MPVHVQLPDGTIGEFPDGMPESQIESVLQKQYGAPQAARPAGLPSGVNLAGLPGIEKPQVLGISDGLKRNFNANTQGAKPGDSSILGAVKDFGAGGGDIIRSAAHPLDTITNMASTPDGSVDGIAALMGNKEAQQREDAAAKAPSVSVARTLGQVGTGAILGDIAGDTLGEIKPLASAARSSAIGDTDAAALRGLKVPNGKKVLPMLDSINTARPYLQGVDSLEDLQSSIKPAKTEIYKPIADTLDAVGDAPIQHPDGSTTTLQALEDERKQLSAMNRGLKNGDPSALQLAQQKGLSQADALAREKAIQGVLDPALKTYGIDPQGIRQAYGAVSRIGNQVAGRSTILETPQPYGFGKLANPFELTKGVELTKPATYVKPLGNIMDAGKDIVAGRYWNGSPTDVGIREGFANAGPKPNFGQYTPFKPTGLLDAPPIELGAPPEVGGTPAGYRPPNFYSDTTPMRTGKLLNAPPIELGGSVEGPKGTPFRYDTTPMRMGRILPEGVSDDMPLSSLSAAFPDQIPQATRIRPKTIEGKK